MTLDLTMADFDMLDDAIFQRAGNAATAREGARWHELRVKLNRAAVALEQEQCACGHSRKNHRGNGCDKCIICQCKNFESAHEPSNQGHTSGSL